MTNRPASPTEVPTTEEEQLAFLEAKTTFDHYPSALELFRLGGRVGLTYGLCPSHSLGKAQRQGWKTVPGWDGQPFPQLTINGPAGTCEGVWVLYKGTPIPGAADGNGKRPMEIFGELVDLTGLGFDNKPVEKPMVVPSARVGRPPKIEEANDAA